MTASIRTMIVHSVCIGRIGQGLKFLIVMESREYHHNAEVDACSTWPCACGDPCCGAVAGLQHDVVQNAQHEALQWWGRGLYKYMVWECLRCIAGSTPDSHPILLKMHILLILGFWMTKPTPFFLLCGVQAISNHLWFDHRPWLLTSTSGPAIKSSIFCFLLNLSMLKAFFQSAGTTARSRVYRYLLSCIFWYYKYTRTDSTNLHPMCKHATKCIKSYWLYFRCSFLFSLWIYLLHTEIV